MDDLQPKPITEGIFQLLQSARLPGKRKETHIQAPRPERRYQFCAPESTKDPLQKEGGAEARGVSISSQQPVWGGDLRLLFATPLLGGSPPCPVKSLATAPRGHSRRCVCRQRYACPEPCSTVSDVDEAHPTAPRELASLSGAAQGPESRCPRGPWRAGSRTHGTGPPARRAPTPAALPPCTAEVWTPRCPVHFSEMIFY